MDVDETFRLVCNVETHTKTSNIKQRNALWMLTQLGHFWFGSSASDSLPSCGEALEGVGQTRHIVSV